MRLNDSVTAAHVATQQATWYISLVSSMSPLIWIQPATLGGLFFVRRAIHDAPQCVLHCSVLLTMLGARYAVVAKPIRHRCYIGQSHRFA